MQISSKSRGFTLLEVLIAFFVFGIIGLISSQLLSQTLKSNENLTSHGTRLTNIHRAMQIIQRDLMQQTNRTVNDGLGDLEGPLVIKTDGTIEFSRLGWRNPLALPRAETQRVGYLVEDGNLVRAYWQVLDRAQDSEPVLQTLLEDVERLEFYALDNFGNEHSFWDTPGSPPPPNVRLVGVLMRIEVAPFGDMERVWELPGA